MENTVINTETTCPKTYWLERLKGDLPNIQLPSYKSQLKENQKNSNSIQYYFPEELNAKISSLQIENKKDYFYVGLSVLYILFYKYGAGKDIIINVDTDENIEAGNKMSTRIIINPEENFQQFYQRVKTIITSDIQHQYAYEDLLNHIAFETGHNTTFNIAFNYVDCTEKGHAFTEHDISFSLCNQFNTLSLIVNYNSDIYETKVVRQFARHFKQLFTEMLLHQETKIASLSCLNEIEKKQFLYDYNKTIVTENQDVGMHELFEQKCIETPNAVALQQHGNILTYKELNEKSNAVAHYLIQQCITAETNVGALCTRSFDMIIVLMGILKSGGSYVPIDPTYPLDRQKYIAENSKVKVVLTNYDAELKTSMPNVTFKHVTEVDFQKHTSNPNIDIKGTQLAYTIYTSGSTGRPKGVMIEHYSAVNLICWVNERFSVNEHDKMLFITSVCFDLSVYDIFGMLAAGGSVVIVKKKEIEDFQLLKNIIKNEGITFWDSVPTTFNYLVMQLEEEASEVLPDLRLVFMSGDWIPVQLPEKAKTFFPNAEIISLGGATEGTVWSNYFPIENVNEEWSSIPYGKPIRNNYFYVLDENLNPVPEGVIGELHIGGIGVARGYDNDPEKTEKSFIPDPFSTELGGRMYKTGDLGRWLPSGNMEFMGRKDYQVKINGNRVELEEIINVLNDVKSISEAYVLAKDNKTGSKYLVAYVVAKEEKAINILKKELMTILHEKLPEYMVPRLYIPLAELPLTPNGKIDRKRLPDPMDTIVLAEIEQVKPSTETEKKIAKIWSQILKVNQIGIHEDFVILGGDSLKGIMCINDCFREFKIKIDTEDFFENSTIEKLAKYIDFILNQKSIDVSKFNSIDL
ncbi:non-ribosomal peptide synthetase [Kordia sp. YSTF-M3]|uniref:Non-ribosomal peptide synthetase n=1 Tax=Kordia aestuariivivens TaxID=2759037 RepID=A0ABR7QH27_9FLAO|nr:non-ribosomal peptide synthetase [Kordia aestuariivivens]MBC8757718.1 non-ribosomal peptide synthetase [Kordia aestuariivivens]